MDHAAREREIIDDLYTLAQSMAERGLFIRDDFGEPSIMALGELDRLVRAVEAEALERAAQVCDKIAAEHPDDDSCDTYDHVAAYNHGESSGAERAAAAIRAMKE